MTREELLRRGKGVIRTLELRTSDMDPHVALPAWVARYNPEDQERALQAMSDELAAAGTGVEVWDRTTCRRCGGPTSPHLTE